jgi:hypothetical protein
VLTAGREPPRHSSDGSDVLRLVALAAWADVEFDHLTFGQGLVAVGLDVRIVNEHVVTILPGDESEALLGVEELDGTCCHVLTHFLSCIGESVARRQGSTVRLRRGKTLP